MTDALPRDRHGARETEARAELVEIERHAGRIGVWRGLLFVTGALAVLLADRLPGATEAWWVGGGLALVAFGVLVRRHRRLRARAARVEAAADLARQGVARIDRRWAELPDPEPFGGDAGAPHPFARDLDLYGHASVRSLLGPVATPMGAERLDGWLLGDPPREEWIARQASVRVLAEAHALRERAAVEAVLLDRVGTDVLERFRRWLAEPADVRGSWLDAARWLLPALTVSAVALDLIGLAPSAPWALLLVAQAAVAFRAARRLHPGFARASSGAPGLRRYHRLVAV